MGQNLNPIGNLMPPLTTWFSNLPISPKVIFVIREANPCMSTGRFKAKYYYWLVEWPWLCEEGFQFIDATNFQKRMCGRDAKRERIVTDYGLETHVVDLKRSLFLFFFVWSCIFFFSARNIFESGKTNS